MKRETELCDAFAARARESGWVVYPETGGWDLLLVHADATQVGVQAKLRPTFDVVSQALPAGMPGDTYALPGPDFRAVLVPTASHAFVQVCSALRIFVYTPQVETWCRAVNSPPDFMRHATTKRHALPPIVPSWSGGAPSPKTLSRWRIGSLRLCALLRSRGYITWADFKAQKVDRSRWVAAGWVRGEGDRGSLRYVPGHNAAGLPDVGYEAERDALAALDAQEAA